MENNVRSQERYMKAQVLHDIGDIRYEEVPLPELKEGWALVKVMAAGICGSDIPRIYRTGAHVHPLIPGHEFSGQVIKTFSGESVWDGKRVGVFPLIPCGECDCCRKHLYEMCSSYNYLGSRCDGGFAEFVAVPEWNLMELPDNVSYRQAAMLEPMAVAVHAVRQFVIDRDSSVCIIGLGTIGLLISMFLKAEGVKRVCVVGNKEAQRKHAGILGIHAEDYYTDIQSAGKHRFDYVFECVGKNETLIQAINIAAPAGHIVFVGNPYSDMDIPKDIYWKILRKQLKVSGTWNSSYQADSDDDWHYVLKHLSEGDIHPEELITHEYALSDIVKGMEIMRDKTEDYVKVMCVNPEC